MFRGLTIYQMTQATDAVLKRLGAALESSCGRRSNGHR